MRKKEKRRRKRGRRKSQREIRASSQFPNTSKTNKEEKKTLSPVKYSLIPYKTATHNTTTTHIVSPGAQGES